MSYLDYFLSIQPDYLEEVFDFFPESSISFSIGKHQNQYPNIEDIKYVSDISGASIGTFSFEIDNLSQAERDEILDLFLNEQKANGMSNSFLFKHPVYDEYFVCKFNKDIEDSLYRHGRHSQNSIEFDIVGVDNNLISQNIEDFIVDEFTNTDVANIASILHIFVHETFDDTMGESLWV